MTAAHESSDGAGRCPTVGPVSAQENSAHRSVRGRTAAGWAVPVGILIGGAAVFFVLRDLARDRQAAVAALRGASPMWMLVSLILCAGAMVAMAIGWRGVLQILGVRAGALRVVGWYFVGEMGKYLPGGVWPVLGRGELARRGGVPGPRAYASVGLSLVLLYLAALSVGVGLLPFTITGSGVGRWLLVLLALPVGLLALHHRFLEWLHRRLSALLRRDLELVVPRWGASVRALLAYVPSWVLVGSGTWAIARALDPGASFPRVAFAAVLSWVVGFVAVPVPAGAGVREAVIVATSGLDSGVGAATALISRLMFLIVDGSGALVGTSLLSRRGDGVLVDEPDLDRGGAI